MSNELTVTFPGGKRVIADLDGFEIATDQSLKNGGQASAPEPFDLFLASLATCAGIYVLGFCQKRNIPHDGLSLTQTWERHEKTKRLEKIRMTVHVPSGFPSKYRTALVRAAGQCSVKKTLEDPPEFEVETTVSS